MAGDRRCDVQRSRHVHEDRCASGRANRWRYLISAPGLLGFVLARRAESGHEFSARVDAELGEDGGHVVLDGALGAVHARGDRRVGQALQQQREDFALARGQTERVLLGARSRPALHAARAERAQPSPRHLGGRRRAESLEALQRFAQIGFAAADKRKRLLIGAAEPCPGLGRRACAARDFERVRSGKCGLIFAWRSAAANEPGRELAGAPRVTERQRKFERRCVFLL